MPKTIFTLCAIFLIGQNNAYESARGELMDKSFIEQVFTDVIENLGADESIISEYFSPHYIQHVDGHTLHYEEFIQHMKVQKTLLDFVKVSILHCVIEGNKISTVHQVDAKKKNGEKISVKVIAYFELEGGKIILCDELTHLLEGDAKDQNIGSIK